MTERIRRLVGLTPGERRLLLYAWVLFLLVRSLLRMFPLTALVPRGRAPGASRSALAVDRIGWLVGVAGRHAPRRPTCLEEALVLAWTLRRAGHVASVRIGVARAGANLRAHAWLEHEGRVLLGPPEGTAYEPLGPATSVGFM